MVTQTTKSTDAGPEGAGERAGNGGEQSCERCQIPGQADSSQQDATDRDLRCNLPGTAEIDPVGAMPGAAAGA